MVLVILSFTGMLLMFVFGLRGLDALQKALNDLKAQMSVDAADLDQRLREIEHALRKMGPSGTAETEEDLGTLLERAARNKQAAYWRDAGNTTTPAAPPAATVTPRILDSLPHTAVRAEPDADEKDAAPWTPDRPLILK